MCYFPDAQTLGTLIQSITLHNEQFHPTQIYISNITLLRSLSHSQQGGQYLPRSLNPLSKHPLPPRPTSCLHDTLAALLLTRHVRTRAWTLKHSSEHFLSFCSVGLLALSLELLRSPTPSMMNHVRPYSMYPPLLPDQRRSSHPSGPTRHFSHPLHHHSQPGSHRLSIGSSIGQGTSASVHPRPRPHPHLVSSCPSSIPQTQAASLTSRLELEHSLYRSRTL